jgi:hypothetical protein
MPAERCIFKVSNPSPLVVTNDCFIVCERAEFVKSHKDGASVPPVFGQYMVLSTGFAVLFSLRNHRLTRWKAAGGCLAGLILVC